jgi:hypothetical protein
MLTLAPYEHKYYDLSTGHITFQDSEILASQSDRTPNSYSLDLIGVRVFWYPEGFFLSLDEPSHINFEKLGLSEDLWNIVRSAFENDVQIIRLDRDGSIVEGLPVHGW